MGKLFAWSNCAFKHKLCLCCGKHQGGSLPFFVYLLIFEITMNTRNFILFLSFLFFVLSSFQANASEQFPSSIQQFNLYLSKVNWDRLDTYLQIIGNIDRLIIETNNSKNLTKIQKRRLLTQYKFFKNRTQILLEKEQKRVGTKIDFWKILQKTETTTSFWLQNKTWATSQMNDTNSQSAQYYTQQSNQFTSSNTTNSSSTVQNIVNNQASMQTNVRTTPLYNEFIIIWASNIQSSIDREFDVSNLPNVEIWRFSISASDEDIWLQSVKFTNIGTLTLSELFSWNPNIQLIDIERPASWLLDCGDLIDWNSLFIQNCQIDPILKWTKRQFKIVIQTNIINKSIGKTIKLSMNANDVSFNRLSDSGSIDVKKIQATMLWFDTYTANYPPPWVTLTRAWNYIFQIKFSNFSLAQNTTEIKSFWFELSQSSNMNGWLLWNICLSVIWTWEWRCWVSWQTSNPVAININSSLTQTNFSLPLLDYTGVINPNSTKEIQITISNDTIITPSNVVKWKLLNMVYSINGIEYVKDISSWYWNSAILNNS